MSTKAKTEIDLIGSAGGGPASPEGERSNLPAARPSSSSRLRFATGSRTR